jgi:hypothetical protein
LQNIYSVPNIQPFCILGPKYRLVATKEVTVHFKTAKKDKIEKQGKQGGGGTKLMKNKKKVRKKGKIG